MSFHSKIKKGFLILRSEGLVTFLKEIVHYMWSRKVKRGYEYMIWIRKNEPRDHELRLMARDCSSWIYQPKISIVVPVFNPELSHLRECIQSMVQQIYPYWELCLVDGGSYGHGVQEIMKLFSVRDSRIKTVLLLENKGIAGNSNEGIGITSGEFVGFLDHDDLLAPFALWEVARYLNQHPDIDFIYSDEDKIDRKGFYRYDPHFKPDWSPDLLLSCNYITHMSIARRTILDKIKGFREGYDGSQDYDLILRITRETDKIAHIPKILYHWRATSQSAASGPEAKPYAYDNGRKAIADHLMDKGIDAIVSHGSSLGRYSIQYKLSRPVGKTSVIIILNQNVEQLRQCVQSITSLTKHENYEIYILGQSSQTNTNVGNISDLMSNSKVSGVEILSNEKSFTLPELSNYAVSRVESDYLLFLDANLIVMNEEWLGALIQLVDQKHIGAAGAKIYYKNYTIKHAGITLGIRNFVGYAHRNLSRENYGYMYRLKTLHNVSAIGGGCMMVKKGRFEAMGGFDQSYKTSLYDVDLCLKMREKKYFVVLTPDAELWDAASTTKCGDGTGKNESELEEDRCYFQSKWKDVIVRGDPFYNPNLTLDREDYSIKI